MNWRVDDVSSFEIKYQRTNISINKIESGTEYRMDEQ